jgi:hypothetical protein
MDPYIDQVRTYAPTVNSVVQATKILQAEVWINELETKVIRRSGPLFPVSASEIELETRKVFDVADDEIFEDGFETRFSRDLIALVNEKGRQAVDVIARFALLELVNDETLSEALRWLGRIDHAQSYKKRLWLLESSLEAKSSRVRDAASLGLASLDDPHAIPHLQRAIDREACVELQDDMKEVLAQLEKTRQCRSF